MKYLNSILFIVFTTIFLAACSNEDSFDMSVETETFTSIVEESATPATISFHTNSGDTYLTKGEHYHIYVSIAKKDIEDVILFVKKNKREPENNEIYSSDLKVYEAAYSSNNSRDNITIDSLNPDTQYFWTSIFTYRGNSVHKISMQQIQSFRTPVIKDWVDIGTTVLWSGYNYFKDNTVPKDFYEAMKPSLFYKSELPKISDDIYRYPTKQELEDLANNCDVIYYSNDYKFVKLRSKINAEVLFIPFTWSSESYSGKHSFPDSGACFFPSENGEFGLEYSNPIGGIRGFKIEQNQFYTWTNGDTGQIISERRGVRFVMDK